MKKDLPFEEVKLNNSVIRTFSESVDTEELKWHRDYENRKIEVIKSNGWKIQFDNELPKPLNDGEFYYIPKGLYHRAIRGSGDLIVKIDFI
jgi:hypothetical protein